MPTSNLLEIKKIIQNLELDSNLIDPSLKKWWKNYLQAHKDHYYELLSILESLDNKTKISYLVLIQGFKDNLKNWF